MHKITSIGLEKIVYFDEPTVLDIRPGLTYVLGRNKQRRGLHASNASGKSLLLGILPNLLFDTHPIITKNVRSVAKQIHVKGSSSHVAWTTNKHKYVFTKSGSTTSISRDGVNTKTRIARDTLKSILDFSEEEFFSTVYLDSRRSNAFQLGTSADRYQFIVNLFRLHDIDTLRKHVNSCISDLTSDGRLLDQAEADIASIRSSLKSLPKDVSAEAAETQKWLQTASAQAQQLSALSHQWEMYEAWLKNKKKLDQLEKPLATVKQLRQQLEAHLEYAAFVSASAKIEEQRSQLESRIKALNVSASHLDADKAMRKLRDTLVVVPKPCAPDQDLDAALLLCKKATQEKALRILSKARVKLAVDKQTLANFDRELANTSVCPTCRSSLSDKTKAVIRNVLEGERQRTEKTEKQASKIVEAYKTVEAWKKYEVDEALYKTYKQVHNKIKSHPFDDVSKHRALNERLSVTTSNNTVVAKPKGKKLELQAQLDTAETYERLADLLAKTQVAKPDKPFDRDALTKLNEEVGKRMVLLPLLQAKATERRLAIKSLTELKSRVSEISERVEDLPVYQMLSDAYSVKGLKALMVKRAAASIEKSLNRYSKQVFSEDLRFSLSVDAGKFDVNVTRTIGKLSKTSDIRMMSGAESRLFVLLFVLAILPLIPSSRRMNILVLDEPDSNMDADTLETFSTRLLPALQKIVPSVIVVTPRSDYMTEGSRIVTVVKENGKSQLIEGRVK